MANKAIVEEVVLPKIAAQRADTPLVKATLLTASMLTVMAAAIVAPALPALQAHFVHVENVSFWARLVLTMPALFIVIGAPIAGLIVDRFGRKPLLVLSTALYGLAGSSGFVLPSLFGILVGRALLGLAVAGVMTSVTTLIADYYSGASRARVLGLQAAFMGLGGTVFTMAGGFVSDLNWRNPFLIYLAAFAILPFIIAVLHEPRRPNSAQAIPAPLASSSECVAEAQRCVEHRAPAVAPSHRQPLSDVRLPVEVLAVIFSIMLLVQLIFYLVPVQLPFYLAALSGADGKQSGLAIAAMTFSFASGSLLSPRISRGFNHRGIIALSFAMTGLGYAVIGTAGSYAVILVGLAMGGLGFGFLVPHLNAWLATEVPTSLRGRALGGLTTFVFLGQFLSPIVTQPLIERVDLGATFLIAGGVLLTIAVVLMITVGLQAARRRARRELEQ